MRSKAFTMSMTGAVAGCLLAGIVASGGSSGAATRSSSGKADKTEAKGVAAASALIKKYSMIPKFTSPGPSFDTSKAAGRTVFNLPASSSVPFVAAVDQELGTYAQDLGLKFVNYPNQQQQAQWVAGMNQATSQKVGAINLIAGIPPEQLAPQIQSAKSAGIPTVDVGERDSNQPTQPYVAAYVFAPFTQAGKLMAAWAVSQTKGKGNILVVTSNADVSSGAVQAGVKSELAATCPSCTVSYINSNPTQWATNLQNTIEGKLSGNPKINYILPVFDAMAEYIAPAITAAGKDGQVHIASYNGTPAILNMLRTGNIVTMDVGENAAYVAAAGLDQDMRLLLGMKPGSEVVTSRVFTKANVAQAGVPATATGGYGTAFLKEYAKTWHVSPSKLR